MDLSKLFLGLACAWTAAGCVRLPSGVPAVDRFELGRYQGTWYEIARLDHPFERGLTQVSATYTPRPDGSIEVWNRGYSPAAGAWKEIKGRARPLPAPAVGRLKVSFFRPFYAAYNVIALDQEGYRYAMVCGPNRSYLWVLAREKRLDPAVLAQLKAKAQAWGFATRELIMVDQAGYGEGRSAP
jgi:apolipoprotein D and lipocalin family protein